MAADPTDGGLPTWATAGIVGIITTLAGGIVGMFKLMRSDAAAQLAEHEKDIVELKLEITALQTETKACRKDREDLRIALAQLEVKVNTNKHISDANHEMDKS